MLLPRRQIHDVLVVGSGASGGWVAKELTERGLTVVVLEAGPLRNPNTRFHRTHLEDGAYQGGTQQSAWRESVSCAARSLRRAQLRCKRQWPIASMFFAAMEGFPSIRRRLGPRLGSKFVASTSISKTVFMNPEPFRITCGPARSGLFGTRKLAALE
jgi:glycine/D-amino acid oxidase-like deaminating enzyme